MSLKLRKATTADIPALVDIYLSAFSSDAISLLVFPRGEATHKFWLDMVTEEILSPTSHYVCIYDSSLPENPVVSFAKWNDPLAPVETADQLPPWPENGDSELADYFFGTMCNKHHEIMGGTKHWYLEMVATKTEYQGRGAAGQLLRWGLERADQDETVAFLEASPAGKPVYERFGFRERDRLVVNLEGKGKGLPGEEEFIEVFMVRDITKQGD